MNAMYVAADHRGRALLEALTPFLQSQGYEAQDLTSPTDAAGMIDFPLGAQAVAKQVAKNNALGILICGSGVGVTIAANRFKGVRAGALRTPEEAAGAKAHNHINIACLGADELTQPQAETILRTWLETSPDTSERRVRRLAQLDEYGS
jgi:ribose 5-phosphate isomerase B